MKKKIIYNEKRKFFWVQNLKWATAHLSRRLGAGQAQVTRGACVGSAGVRWVGALGLRRQARQACVGAGRGAQAGVRGRPGRRRPTAAARERSGRVGVRGSWAQAQARGRALGARQAGCWARGRQALGARGRAAWASGLALGSALGPFSIRFDSFFFLSHQMNTVHCKIKFFRKKKYLFNSNKIK